MSFRKKANQTLEVDADKIGATRLNVYDRENKMKGHIYFLINRAMPGLIKIGHPTMGLNNRLSQLNSTGVPVPFEIGASFYVQNAQKCETEIHRLLKPHRVSKGREFFKLPLYDAVNLSIKVVQKDIFDSEGLSKIIEPFSLLYDFSNLEISIF